MAITDIYGNCSYKRLRLKNQVLLFSETDLKKIRIDDTDDPHIEEIGGTPLVLDCVSVDYSEDASLDGRYEFGKTLTFTVNGYGGLELIGDRKYAAIETYDGVYYLVNDEFKADVSYEFILDGESYSTTYTFFSHSNHPSLRIEQTFGEPSRVCDMMVPEVDTLSLNYFRYTRLDRDDKVLTTSESDFMRIPFLSCTLSESYEDGVFLSVVQFTLPFGKSSFHYSLTEFEDNLYAAIVRPKGSTNTLFAGFDLGLQVSYSIESSTEAEDIVTISMEERSNVGIASMFSWSEEVISDKKWVNLSDFYECNGSGTAFYLLKQEQDGLGNPTGRYQCYTGMTDYFSQMGYDIQGEFSEQTTFNTSNCKPLSCMVSTTIPNEITFYLGDSSFQEFTMYSDCNWEIDWSSAIGLSVLPSNGVAGRTYTVRINNRSYGETQDLNLSIVAGETLVKPFKVTIRETAFMTPSEASVDCNGGTISFVSNSPCDYSVTVNSLGILVTRRGSSLLVTVPPNQTESARDFSFTVRDCIGKGQTVVIHQDKLYKSLERVNGEYICEDGKTYELLTVFTGTTLDTLAPTSTREKGSLLDTEASKCATRVTRWRFRGNYLCVDGNKYELLEEEYKEEGDEYWDVTSETSLGNLVESGSAWCDEIEYGWQLDRTHWVCEP